MRMNASLISLLTGIAVAGLLAVTGWTFAAPGSLARFADKRPNAVPVDVELVLAVDVSYSMDPEEQALQREGYITGITSRAGATRSSEPCTNRPEDGQGARKVKS